MLLCKNRKRYRRGTNSRSPAHRCAIDARDWSRHFLFSPRERNVIKRTNNKALSRLFTSRLAVSSVSTTRRSLSTATRSREKRLRQSQASDCVAEHAVVYFRLYATSTHWKFRRDNLDGSQQRILDCSSRALRRDERQRVGERERAARPVKVGVRKNRRSNERCNCTSGTTCRLSTRVPLLLHASASRILHALAPSFSSCSSFSPRSLGRRFTVFRSELCKTVAEQSREFSGKRAPLGIAARVFTDS